MDATPLAFGLARLVDLLSRHAPHSLAPPLLPGVTLWRADAPKEQIRSLYRPSLCVIAQGRKQIVIGRRVVEYDARQSLVVGTDLAVVGHVIQATARKPYLSVAIDLDSAVVAQVMLDQPAPSHDASDTDASAIDLAHTDPALLDAVVRLVGLLDEPALAPTLAPLIMREILVRLLCGAHGKLLRRLGAEQSTLARIARAARRIHDRHAEPLDVATLAAEAGMSATSFHRHFKAVTGTSPLQFRTQARMQEARRLLLLRGRDAGAIGFQVGYESAAQFTREYRRTFGRPPAKDAAVLRETMRGHEVSAG